MQESDSASFFRKNPGMREIFELFESLPQIVFYAKDLKSRFVRVNARFLENHGLQKESDVLGLSDHALHPPVMARAYITEDRKVMKGGKPIRNQVWPIFYGQRMTLRWFVSTKSPLSDPTGKVIGLAGVMYEIEQSQEYERFFHELAPVIHHFKDRYAQMISMVEMAALSGLSSTHFNRRFQQLLRMTPTAYLLAIRIQAARRLISSTNKPLAEIAQESGFSDQSHFTRRFRENTGLTPSQYRTRFRKET